MTTPTDTDVIRAPYDYNSFPFLAPRTTESRMRHFSQGVYNIGPHTHLYKFIDALCGDGGAGSLKKELLFAQFNQNLDSIFFRDLDNIFGQIASFIRYASETYEYDPFTQQLTTDQWSEVMTKDAAYRQRIKDFMLAIGMGGTPQGIRMMCRAALGVDCELYEVSYYIDSGFYTSYQSLGRTNASMRNELVVRPLISSIPRGLKYLATRLIERIKPMDTVLTIDNNGLAIHATVPINNVAASSSYFQVVKEVTGTRDIADLPPTTVLSQDLGIDPSYLWVRPNTTVEAPSGAFQATQEASQYYIYAYDGATAVDTVEYCEDAGSTRKLNIVPFTQYRKDEVISFGPWTPWDRADSPDNYPGGKFGQTPFTTPALTTNGQNYVFPYTSQDDFVARQTNVVVGLGGEATTTQFRLPVTKLDDVSRRVWTPELAIPLTPPTQQSTVSSQWLTRSTSTV
jgi:hypothetical protein